MASTDAWTDYDQIRHAVKQNTVDRLKQIITGFNEECGTNLSKSGKKQDIIDRIGFQLQLWRDTRAEEKWLNAKNILAQVRTYGCYNANRASATPLNTGMASMPGYHATPATYASSSATKLAYPSLTLNNAATSSIGRYDPYAPPRKAQPPPAGSTTTPASRPPTIRFRDSPFFRIDQQIGNVVECPESSSAMDRRQQNLNFTLNPDHLHKLKQEGSRYQLRLFCTSSMFYTPSTPLAFRSTMAPCPIEFPPTCEVRVNGTQLTANLKGLKKKPGTAPPPDLGKSVRWNISPNRVEMVYVNSTQPMAPKKFFLAVMLVETTSVDDLVENLRRNSRRTAQEIREKMVESANDDDDIQSGPQKMSLKCPLSYMRVNTPCRSSKCVHSQCFDATSWFSMMEQTTTYLCPTCERTLDYRDLIVDGYFDEILKSTPESVEDVMVEADGEWHTSDNKYASERWKAIHPVVAKPASPSKPLQPVRPPSQNQDKGKSRSNAEVVILSDSDDDEGQVKRELSPSNSRSLDSFSFTMNQQAHQGPSANQGTSQLASEVIDLTLSDEEDDPAPPPPARTTQKRTAEVADLDYNDPWKKSRTSVDHQPQPHHHQQLPPIHYAVNHDAQSRTLHPLPLLQNGIANSRTPPNVNPYRQPLTESRHLPPPPIDAYPNPPRANGMHPNPNRWPQ